MEKRYLALPRGVNISGKNKVPMAELRQGLEALGLAEGKTHLNSGNAAFTCRETETGALAAAIEGMIRQRFSLEVPRLRDGAGGAGGDATPCPRLVGDRRPGHL